MGWRGEYQARNWTAVENWWRRTDDLDELKALFAQLQRDVPRRTLTNGMDVHVEFQKSKDAPEEWRGASLILEFGELEAKINGDPSSDIELWAEQQTSLSKELQQLVSAPEVTKGDGVLSRRAQAERALEALQRVNEIVGLRIGVYTPDEQEPLREFVAQVAINAMRAGYFAYAAESKVIQADAVRGKKVVKSASNGGENRSRELSSERQRRLRRIGELIEYESLTISAASAKAAKEGIGKSRGANIKLWNRHMK
jgi:hypothetical protein